MDIEFITENLLKPLIKELIRTKKQRNDEVSDIYNNFGDPLLLSEFYIQPNCQHHNPSDYDEDEGRSLIKTPAFSVINEFLNGRYMNKDGRNQLFILSDAGMGKTSLLMMIKLMNIFSFWPTDYYCKLLKLGKNTITEIDKIKSKRNTVLLLDALDEDPEAWGNIEKRLINILEITKDFRNIIITCRTQFFPEKELNPFGDPGRVVVGGYLCPMLFLSLFDDNQINKYLIKKFEIKWHTLPNKRKKLKKDITESKHILSNMKSLRFRPLLLSHIEDILKSKTKHWDTYNIYKALVDIWLLREQRKLQELYKKEEKTPDREDLLKACIYLAEYMHVNFTRYINNEQISSIISKYPDIEHLKNFDLGGRSLLNINSDGYYRFSHYSIQEFLLCEGLILNMIPSYDIEIRATDQLMDFLEIIKPEMTFLYPIDYSSLNITGYFRRFSEQPRYINGIRLNKADLSECHLEDSEINNAELINSDFSNGKLHHCKIQNSNLENSNLTKVNLRHAVLINNNLSNTILNNADLDNSKINGINLSHSKLKEAKFNHSTLNNVDLSYADLTGVKFNHAKLHNVNLSNANLSNADFTDTHLSNINVSNIIVGGTKVKGSELEQHLRIIGIVSDKQIAKMIDTNY